MDNAMSGAADTAAEKKSCVYPIGETLTSAQRQFDHLARTALKPCERWICRDADFEDRRQEGLGRCWEWYCKQVIAGTVPDTALIVHACSLAMKNRSRTLVGHEHRPRHDVYDRQGLDLELRRLDGVRNYDDDDDRHEEQDPALGLARPGVANPEMNLLSAMDLDNWLQSLTSADRELMEMRGAGYGYEEIGVAVGKSTTGAFRRARDLGSQLADHADVAMNTLHG
ncbi:MAG: hypothetical protein JXB32_26015, partial [Deltaproteobacteria bacterium]|nr:hypothetical protein [Deltaproteobacteria bacterium]